uniref:Uncharacterized protein n=1 Tax=Cannabis sativa TaxID=3483 RepID=A0A803NIG3_CANSA
MLKLVGKIGDMIVATGFMSRDPRLMKAILNTILRKPFFIKMESLLRGSFLNSASLMFGAKDAPRENYSDSEVIKSASIVEKAQETETVCQFDPFVTEGGGGDLGIYRVVVSTGAPASILGELMGVRVGLIK